MHTTPRLSCHQLPNRRAVVFSAGIDTASVIDQRFEGLRWHQGYHANTGLARTLLKLLSTIRSRNLRGPVPELRDSIRVARKRRALAVLIADQSLETLQKCGERFRRDDEFRFDAADLIGAWAGRGHSHASGKLSRASGPDHLHPHALFTFFQSAEEERGVACVRSNA